MHAPATRRAVTDPHVEAAHARHHHRQVFLILRRYARRRHGTGTVRTRGRHRDRDDLVDAPRRGPVPVAAVARPCSAPAASWLWRGRAFRERCRLPCARPTRQVEFVLQPLVLTAQPVAVALQSDAFCFRPFKLAPQPCNFAFAVPRSVRPIRHIEVMPDSGQLYTSKMFGMEGQTR